MYHMYLRLTWMFCRISRGEIFKWSPKFSGANRLVCDVSQKITFAEISQNISMWAPLRPFILPRVLYGGLRGSKEGRGCLSRPPPSCDADRDASLSDSCSKTRLIAACFLSPYVAFRRRKIFQETSENLQEKLLATYREIFSKSY